MPKLVTPGPDQESVWAYPRPPHVEATSRHVQVYFNGEIIADSTASLRVLETSHPPVYYIPMADIRMEFLSPVRKRTFCEFKGQAGYYDVRVGEREAQAAVWHYPDPDPGYNALHGHVAFYPSRMDACYVDGEQVTAQEGDFYGGWITSEIAGPFKGAPGTLGW